MTPYRLYMKEHYVSLKAQCDDDKRAIFAKCHEMWEDEPEHVKEQYARMVEEEANATAIMSASSSGDDTSKQRDDENDTETSFSRTFDAASAAGAYLAKQGGGCCRRLQRWFLGPKVPRTESCWGRIPINTWPIEL